jgi:LPS-assembly lipoprotein
MWWREGGTLPRRIFGKLLTLAVIFVTAGMTAGCFQPLYGTGGPDGAPAIRSALSSIDVEQIEAPNGTPEARLGVEVRNALIFNLTGGAAAQSPTHKLKIAIFGSRQNIIVDSTTARAENEIYGIDATYTLTELATNRVVLQGRAFGRATYDIPGQQQRFARARGQRDAENRSATIIADQIKSRLASYFVAGS